MSGSASRLVPAVAALMLCCGVAAPVLGQGIKATVDRREATIEDQIVFQLTVEGAQSARPHLPSLPDFKVYPRGQSSQIQIVNGRTSASLVFNYILVPSRTGTFTIGPATVQIDGTTYSSQPINIHVLDATATPQDSREAFVTAKVSTTRPYVGQQVVFTWRFYRRVRVGGANFESFEFPGFLVEDLGELREYQTVVEGQQYLVSEFRKALFAQEEGSLTIPPTVLRCDLVVSDPRRRRSVFDDFFTAGRTQTKLLRTRPIELDVRPLPPAPAGFSGLVGRFDVSAQVSKRSLQVGESATLSLTVSGTGNAPMIAEPALPDLAGFKVYDDQPASSMDTTGEALSGRKTFTKALVPLEAGELTIPAVALSYFDPGAGEYRTARSRAITLEVRPAEGQEELRLTESIAPTTGKVAVRILADDILPIARGLDAVAGPPPLLRSPVVVACLLLAPPLVWLALVLGLRRRRRLELDSGLRRRRAALRTARRSLRRLDCGDQVEVARQGSRCLRTYVGDKLGLEGSALTPAEVREALAENGVAETLVEQVLQVLNRLEAAQYGAATLDGGTLGDELGSLVSQLESALKGRLS